MAGEPQLSKLDSSINDALESIKKVRRTDSFNLEPDAIRNEMDDLDAYKSPYKTSIQTTVFFGPIFIEDAFGIEISESNTKTPVYPYASAHFGAMLPGKYLVSGRLFIAETKTAQLHSLIAKYKELIETEKDESTIRDIALQRLNLFRANIETKLITRFGIEKAAKISERAINKISSEVISGLEWRIPKLVIVSGNLSDPEPLIDVFEDIDLNSAAKSILTDGGTQVKAYSFTGRLRPTRDEPPVLISPNKYKLDLPKSLREYVKNYVFKLKGFLKIRSYRSSIPFNMHPNNLMYLGNLPQIICGWGPKFCITSFLIRQDGLPNKMIVDSSIYLYRALKDPDTDQPTGEFERPKPYTFPIPLINHWRFLYPDADMLASGIRAVSQTVPTTGSLAFTWLDSPPALPEETANVYQDSIAIPLSGSVLTSAFFGIKFGNPDSTDTNSYHREPVRDYAFVNVPKSDPNKDVKELTSYLPIAAPLLRKAQMENSKINWNSLDELSFTDEYQFEQWYYVVPDGFLGSLNSWSGGIIEDVTSGVLGNLNKINSFKDTLKDIPDPQPSSGIMGFNIQVFPLAIQKTTFDTILLSPLLELIGDAFTKNSLVTTSKSHAIDVILNSGTECINDAVIYSWSVAFGKIPQEQMKAVNDANGNTIGTVISGYKNQAEFKMSLAWTDKGLKKVYAGPAGLIRTPATLIRVIMDKPDFFPATGNTPNLALDNLRNTTQYISAASSVPSSFIEMNIDVRCDRTMARFDSRSVPGWNTIENLIEEGLNKEIVRDESAMFGYDLIPEEEYQDRVKTWYANTRMNDTYESYIDHFNKSNNGPILGQIGERARGLVSGISNSIIGVGSLGYSVANRTWSSVTNFPAISQTLDTLSTVGFDLKGVFEDSTLDNNDAMTLKNITVFSESSGYACHLSKIANSLASEFKSLLATDRISSKLDDSYIESFAENGIYGKSASRSGIALTPAALDSRIKGKVAEEIDNIIITYLEDELRKQFSVVNGWSIIKGDSTQLDRLNVGSNPFSTENDNNTYSSSTKDNEVLFIIRDGITPSPLILDKIQRDNLTNIGNIENDNSLKKGIVL